MNYQLLGNSVPHLHVHLVPRYLDDPAPGKPLPWEPKLIAQPEYDRQLQLLTDVAKTQVPISVSVPETPDSN
jgi:diadenosine tetraphosphate (Ap4A) HIT family hydrolase